MKLKKQYLGVNLDGILDIIDTSHGIMLNREKLDLKALILTAKT